MNGNPAALETKQAKAAKDVLPDIQDANTSLSFAAPCKSPKLEMPKECHTEKHMQNEAILFLLRSQELSEARIASNSCISNTLYLTHSSQQ